MGWMGGCGMWWMVVLKLKFKVTGKPWIAFCKIFNADPRGRMLNMLKSIGKSQDVTKPALRSSIECRVFVKPKNRLTVVKRNTVGETVWIDPLFGKGGG